MKLPFKLQSDLCPCLTSREIEKYSYQGFCHLKKTTRRTSLGAKHTGGGVDRAPAAYVPREQDPPSCASSSHLQNFAPPAHTHIMHTTLLYKQLEVWNTPGLSHPSNSKKGQDNSHLCPQFQKVSKVNPVSTTTASSSRDSNRNIGSVLKICLFPGG